MAITGTSALANEIKPLYDAQFLLQGQSMLYFDQFCYLRTIMNGQRGSSLNFPLVPSLLPNTAKLDELTDVTSQAMTASEISVSLSEYGGAVDVTRLAVATSYADVCKQVAYLNGYNLAESIDIIARTVFGTGSRVFYSPNGGATSRITLVRNTDRLSAAFIEQLAMLTGGSGMPRYEDNALCAIVHPFCWFDLLQDTGIRNMSTFSHPEMLFNGEVGYWGGIRLISSNNAKGFWGQGAAVGTAVNTTITSAVARGDTTMVVLSATNIAVGQWLNVIDATEAGNTWSDTNELVRVTGVSGTTITIFAYIAGPGTGGGFRYAHASGKAITNAASAFPIPVFGPESITKIASDHTGPYGTTVISGPYDKLGRFLTFGWYLLAGYGLTYDPWLSRGEVSSSWT